MRLMEEAHQLALKQREEDERKRQQFREETKGCSYSLHEEIPYYPERHGEKRYPLERKDGECLRGNLLA